MRKEDYAWMMLWASGKKNGMTWEVKHYEVGSEWGINGGRISKLHIQDEATGKWLVNYDRGWDIKPDKASAKTKALYKEILTLFN